MVWTTEIIDFLNDKDILSTLKESPYLTNNRNCRKPNLAFKLTDLEKFEYYRCKADIIYFAENYCIIQDHRLQMNAPIALTDIQQAILRSDDKISINESSRQTGVSTAYAILSLHSCLFKSNYLVGLVDSRVECSIEQLSKIKNFYFNLPFFLQAGIVNITNNYLAFDNYSKVLICSSKNMVRGFTPNLHIAQSAEHYNKNSFNEMLNYLIPSINCRKDMRMIIQHSDEEYFKENEQYRSWVNEVKASNKGISFLDCKGMRIGTRIEFNDYLTRELKSISCDMLKSLMNAMNINVRNLRNMVKES